MKKIVSLFICVAFLGALTLGVFALTGENYALFSSSSNVKIPMNEHIGGDVNGDGSVTLLDVVALLRVTVGDTYNTSVHAIDVNLDGKVNVVDILSVLSHVLGYDVGLGAIVK